MKLTTKLYKQVTKEDRKIVAKICECSTSYVGKVLIENRESSSELAKRILNTAEATIECRLQLEEFFKRNPDANAGDYKMFPLICLPASKKEEDLLEEMYKWALKFKPKMITL